MTRKIINVSDLYRIESGPKRCKRIATKSIFENGSIGARYQVGGKDSFGKKIILGEEFSYLDDYSEPDWYLYSREASVPKKLFRKRKENTSSWYLIGNYSSEQKALEAIDGIS